MITLHAVAKGGPLVRISDGASKANTSEGAYACKRVRESPEVGRRGKPRGMRGPALKDVAIDALSLERVHLRRQMDGAIRRGALLHLVHAILCSIELRRRVHRLRNVARCAVSANT